MLRATSPGVYLAHHPWLDYPHGAGEIYKVGHSEDLSRRIHDSAYTTCYTLGWRYAATYELASKEDAERLETAVLQCCHNRRLDGRELVRVRLPELTEIVLECVRILSLTTIQIDGPVYELPHRLPAIRAVKNEMPEVIEKLARLTLDAEPFDQQLVVEVLIAEDVEPPVTEDAEPPPKNVTDDDMQSFFDHVAVEIAAAPPIAIKVAPIEVKVLPQLKPMTPPGTVDDEDFADYIDASTAVVATPLEVRPYQVDAHARCVQELRENGLAVLQMACRCGKTAVAYNVIDSFIATGGSALFLVPTLGLLRQTAIKLIGYGHSDSMLLVGSDALPVRVDTSDGKTRELPMTTDANAIREFLDSGDATTRRIVISTYQSSCRVPTDRFAVTVFDEAHRVCGGIAPRPFNYTLLAPRVGVRLFVTATPANEKLDISMSDRSRFGGVAYKYSLRQGITAGYVNDFRLEMVLALDSGKAFSAQDAELAIPAQIHAAMKLVTKLLVFARDTAHASRLCKALRAAPLPPGVEPFECFEAHSKMAGGPAAREAVCARFATPGIRCAMINCRYYQEGVEISALDGVMFAAPRHAPRDIVQSLCRSLNRMPGKRQSVIFLPVTCNPNIAFENPVESFKRYKTVLPFVDALLTEDPRLYDYVMDHENAPYPLGVVSTCFGLQNENIHAALLTSVRRAVRYGDSKAKHPAERLMRMEKIPWSIMYTELLRVTTQFNRYPKSTETIKIGSATVNFHGIWEYCKKEYLKYAAGEQCNLEPYQLRDLESLKEWKRFGLYGPYMWDESMACLETWLAEHGGVPPKLDTNRGGFICMSNSPLERLAGTCMILNQSDGKAKKGNKDPRSGYTIKPHKEADLERICAPYGLRWRKERTPSGVLVVNGPPTFIQDSLKRFKEHLKQHGETDEYIQQHFSGFPGKHKAQEEMRVIESGIQRPDRKPPKRMTPKQAKIVLNVKKQ